MTIHVATASVQFEIAESSKALTELVSNAGRKRRIFDEELEEKTRQRRRCIILAASSGFLAALIGVSSLIDIDATPYFVIGGVLASAMSGCFACIVLLMDHSALYNRLHADTAVCDALIRLMKGMRRDDAHASLVGREVLLSLSKEFKQIADSYEKLDESEFEVFEWRSQENQKFKIKRHDRIRPRHTSVNLFFEGQKWNARIKDISRSGVALNTTAVIDRGALVTIGSTPARAVRLMEKGVAFEFLTEFPPEKFSKAIRL